MEKKMVSGPTYLRPVGSLLALPIFFKNQSKSTKDWWQHHFKK